MAGLTAIVAYGGWEGHRPKEMAESMVELLAQRGIAASMHAGLDVLLDETLLADAALFVPMVTMGEIEDAQLANVLRHVRDRGLGVAGCHGGMGDSFRSATEWHFMVGGQFVAHPGDSAVVYRVQLCREPGHPIVEGLPDFEIASEQYYLHVDPGVQVLATTEFPTAGAPGPHDANPCRMPQAWVKQYGQGRVFYFAVGHEPSVFDQTAPRELMARGLAWAAGALNGRS